MTRSQINSGKKILKVNASTNKTEQKKLTHKKTTDYDLKNTQIFV